jgi:hypothetical protein
MALHDQIWQILNNQHGGDRESREIVRWEVLHKELEYLYDRRPHYPLQVQWILCQLHTIHIEESITKIAD